MFSERIEFVQRKFSPLFSQDNEVIFFNPETPSHCLSFYLNKLVAYQTFLPVVEKLERAGIKCVQSMSQQKYGYGSRKSLGMLSHFRE